MTPRGSPKRDVRAVVLDEAGAEPGSVAVLRVLDLPEFLAARSMRPHGDVVDALVDLVVALIDEEGAQDEGPDR